MKIHHIGMLSANIEKEARHLCESCGYERVSDEIVDEIQTAKVLFLKLPAENSLLELISPHGENSKLDGAMKKGIKFHHICFQSDDMESDLKKFRNNGFFTLCEPIAAAAFDGRKIAWVMDSNKNLFELVESRKCNCR